MKSNKIIPQAGNYASPLADIPDAPRALFVRGALPKKRTPSVAIVGTRRPTPYGREVAYTIAYELAQQGVTIVSGLALGIDAIAHKATLDAGGTTIAVLATSVEYITPRTNAQLGEQIITSQGAVVSEYSNQQSPRPHHFLQRNRIVSGLADALIIIEAASRSGTLSTATHALEQGREVFAVPGAITSPLSSGCNKLIQQGATPLLSSDDVLHVIAPEALKPQTSLPLGSTPLEAAIIELLAEGLRDGDELLQKSAASAAEFSQALTMLELNDIVRPLGANQWTLK